MAPQTDQQVVDIKVPEKKAASLLELAKRLDADVLEILAIKSMKPNINQKVRDYKNFL